MQWSYRMPTVFVLGSYWFLLIRTGIIAIRGGDCRSFSPCNPEECSTLYHEPLRIPYEPSTNNSELSTNHEERSRYMTRIRYASVRTTANPVRRYHECNTNATRARMHHALALGRTSSDCLVLYTPIYFSRSQHARQDNLQLTVI